METMEAKAINRVLVVNPGSTSTKIAVYETAGKAVDEELREVFSETLRHDAEELQKLGAVADQLEFRKQVVMDALQKNGFSPADFTAIACRGGLVRQLPSGTYRVKILLPADMRGYDSMQVAYVDEYGDVQVYDAKVEGNYLVFETVHFSTFYVVGLLEQHRHYDAYAYAAIVAAFILIMVYLIRVVRLDANGGTGRSSVFVFLGDGEGSLPAAGYSREGYELAGWSRDREGSEIIPASAELSSLGKIHFLKLYAVWQKKEGEN